MKPWAAWLELGMFASGVALPATVSAGNGGLPRTPVIHTEERCMTLVDADATDSVTLPYTIPFADTCPRADDLPDSRTHQFVAFCRGYPVTRPLPHWLSRDDVEAAENAQLLPAEPPEGDVLEENPLYANCWLRIVADAERRPIDCAHALAGATWNVGSVPSGAYVVAGYTFDPPLNLWVPRSGVFKIVRGGDDPPAVGASRHATLLGSEDTLALEICLDGPVGSRLSASWANANDDTSWTEFAALDDPADGSHVIELFAPALPGGTTMLLRLELSTASGETFRYDSPDAITLVPGTIDPSEGDPPFDFCRDDPDATKPQACGTTDQPEPETPGCGCRTATHPNPFDLVGPLTPLVFGLTRRRRPRCGGSPYPRRTSRRRN